MILAQMTPLAPMVFLALWAMVMLVHGAWTNDARGSQFLALAGFGMALVLQLMSPVAQATLFGAGGGPLVDVSPFSTLGTLVVLCLAVLCVPLVAPAFEREGEGRVTPEFWVLAVLLVAGLLVMLAAADFLVLYMGLELASFASYILVAYARHRPLSTEAGLKYFVLGSLATALMLYGVALLYAVTGTTNFLGMAGALHGAVGPLGQVAMLLVLSGVLFKLSIVPFHMWTPDVYEGAPTAVTAVLAALPKVAALAVLLRLLGLPFAALAPVWQPVLAVLALASMALGAVMAILQSDLKRLVGWSTVVNLGFVLAGVAAGGVVGFGGALFYLVVYSLTNIGLFAGIIGTGAVRVDDLRGLGKTHPGTAAALTIVLLSLAGIPPLGGFMAKVAVLTPLVQGGLAWLAVGGVLCSVVAAFYSLNLLKTMWFLAPPETPVLRHGPLGLHLWLMAGLLAVVGIFPSLLQALLGMGVVVMY